jgi:hypothetical protein
VAKNWPNTEQNLLHDLDHHEFITWNFHSFSPDRELSNKGFPCWEFCMVCS